MHWVRSPYLPTMDGGFRRLLPEITYATHEYGYTYDKRGNLVKEEEICSPTTTGPRNITMDLKKLQTTTLR